MNYRQRIFFRSLVIIALNVDPEVLKFVNLNQKY